MIILQLNPTLPVYSVEHKMQGYAYIIIDYSQEHSTIFLVGLDNGELWWIDQTKIRLQKNITLNRNNNKNE